MSSSFSDYDALAEYQKAIWFIKSLGEKNQTLGLLWVLES